MSSNEPAELRHGQEITTVAMVIHNYLPTLGGAQRQLNSLVPLLKQQGIVPTVYARSLAGEPATEMLNGARVVRVPCVGPKPMQSTMFVFGTLWHLFRTKPDVVHAYDTLTPALAAGFYRLASGTPYLTKLLRSGDMGDLNRLANKPLGEARLKLLKRSVTKFVAISQDLEAELDHWGVETDRRVFIPNGVDTERFQPPNVTELGSEHDGASMDRAQRGLQRRHVFPDWPNGPVVVVVGRISPEKRVVELAQSWERILERHPGAWLYVVGDGPVSGDLAGIGSVRLLGRREDIPEILRWSDLYVSASAAEGLSNALLEAMASACPCVVTNVGGVADVMTNNVDGRIVEDEGPGRSTTQIVNDIVDQIIDLLDDPDQRLRLGGAARQAVIDRYSLATTAGALADEYRTLGREKVTR